jgi:hypothetical protein
MAQIVPGKLSQYKKYGFWQGHILLKKIQSFCKMCFPQPNFFLLYIVAN